MSSEVFMDFIGTLLKISWEVLWYTISNEGLIRKVAYVGACTSSMALSPHYITLSCQLFGMVY